MYVYFESLSIKNVKMYVYFLSISIKKMYVYLLSISIKNKHTFLHFILPNLCRQLPCHGLITKLNISEMIQPADLPLSELKGWQKLKPEELKT